MSYKYLIILLFLVSVVFCGWWFGGNFLWEFWKSDQANLRGDAYGAINTLFSGLAFVGIIISIIMQSEELRLQREELKATRDVFQRDIFEKGFYNLIDLLESTLDGFRIESRIESGDKSGKEGLTLLIEKGFIRTQSGNIFINEYSRNGKMNSDQLNQFLNLNFEGASVISVYIKTFNVILTSIFKKIENSEDERYYLAILKSRLSYLELELIRLHSSNTLPELRKYYESFLGI